MAGGDEVETNEDLGKKLDEVLADPLVSAIVMAAAICDFEPAGVGWGKDEPRLNSKQPFRMWLSPAEKLIDKIKQKRPDIFLATFKTTSNESLDTLQYKATENLERCGADIVLGNDIKNKYNILVTQRSCVDFDVRDECLHALAIAVGKHLK